MQSDSTEQQPLEPGETTSQLGPDFWRSVIEYVQDYAIFTLAPDNTITSWNTGATFITGYSETEVLGQSGAILFTSEDCAAGAVEQEVYGARMTGRSIDERWHLRKDGTRFYGSGVMTAMRDAAGTLRGFVKVVRDVTAQQQAQAALTASQHRLQALFNHSLDAILIADDQGRYIDANPAACALTGYTYAELLRLTVMDVAPPQQRDQVQLAWQTFLRNGAASGEYPLLRKDGSTVVTEFRAVAHIMAGLHLSILHDIRERKQAEDALRRAQQELEQRVEERTAELALAQKQVRAVLHELLTTQETERRGLALEVNEQFGQLVSALQIELSMLATGDLGSEPPVQVLARLKQIAAQLNESVSQMSQQLRPSSLDDLGLLVAVQRHTELWAAKSGIAAEFEAIGLDTRGLPAEVETVVYRVLQEVLANVLKHAQAQHVSVLLNLHDQQFDLIVEDNGQGFTVEQVQEHADSQGQLGLLGMRERVAMIGGTLTIEARPKAGTTVYVRVPLLVSPH